MACDIASGVPIYHGQALPIGTAEGQRSVAAEWAHALSEGPGIICIRGAFAEQMESLNAVTECFKTIIEQENLAGNPKGDHFAQAGANSRIWNALEKVAVNYPQEFVDYYKNPFIALASRSWLGPCYQVTSQVNVVRPGGRNQEVHRDYHLGFQTDSASEQYPAHVHSHISPMLTLQGSIAHSDMPLESGPTLFMPHSQKYLYGYLAWRLPEIKEYFSQHHTQIPLRKGDAVFFNPALFHAAGSNTSSNIQRIANLLQCSSAMGRAMEIIDRPRICLSIYPALLKMMEKSGCSKQELMDVIAASAEGYSFPTNLDIDQPVNGNAPKTQAELLTHAVIEKWEAEKLKQEMIFYARRHTSAL
eukprot:TRINITY_DN9175_c0_g1_i1.p1 TRINITY_DN9175_c0_g1~~TRINITY_DN9175_c0_g1_i1.p1  ORF type:complete len:419 (-),score=57.47 TRINITY_DN9175_c0_g1_i1:300-1379(-)